MLNAAIVGAGIGGLTTALALRARGIEAVVYEAAAELRPLGAGLLVSPNALQVLGRIGLADEVLEQGWPLERAEIHDARSGMLQRLNMADTARRYGLPTVAIHRYRLHEVLLAALGSSQLELGRECSSVADGDAKPIVTFSDDSTLTAGVVVGADGLRSTVRRYVAPEATVRYSGQTSWRAIAEVQLPAEMAYESREIWDAHRRFGFAPVERGMVYWFATLDAREGGSAQPEEEMARLRRIFAAFPLPVGDLLRSTPARAVVRTDISDLAPFRGWSRGRVVLLGDAAHATTPNLGQGAAQAIEDAWVLAEQLSRGGTVEAALVRYEQARAPKAEFIVRRSRQFGRVAHTANPLLRALRNTMIRATPRSFTEREMDRVYTLGY